jgi:hypothetical protein
LGEVYKEVSMGNDIKQFKAIEDDCIYFYDKKKKCFRKICDIESFKDLPLSVRRQMKAAQEEAAEIMEIPIE